MELSVTSSNHRARCSESTIAVMSSVMTMILENSMNFGHGPVRSSANIVENMICTQSKTSSAFGISFGERFGNSKMQYPISVTTAIISEICHVGTYAHSCGAQISDPDEGE